MKSIEKLTEEQLRKWHFSQTERTRSAPRPIPIVTISREPGSGGRIIGEKVAERLGYDLFHQEVLHEMARSANVSASLVATLDEKGLNVLEEWVASLVDSRHLWPDQYMKHLMKVVGTIGRHGQAVLIGRGANYILPPELRLSVRVIAPFEFRARQVAQLHGIPVAEARRRISKTDAERRAFVRKYFHADVAAPEAYDLLINTATLALDSAIDAICGALSVCKTVCALETAPPPEMEPA
jgi:cytidylate kinase